MQKVNGWPVGDHSRPPINHGKPWSDDHVELAERKLREGWSVKMVADTISRQPSAVISKLEKLGVINSDICGGYYYFSENKPSPKVAHYESQGCTRNDEENQQTEKETTMTNHVFETKTFIDGKDVATYSAESLLTMADKVVTRMKKLEAISEAYGAASADPSTLVLTALQAEYSKCKDSLVKIMNIAAEKLNAANSTAE